MVQTVYIKDEQVLELNEESKLCENTWGVLDILDDKETTTEDNNETKVYLKEELLSTTMFMNINCTGIATILQTIHPTTTTKL